MQFSNRKINVLFIDVFLCPIKQATIFDFSLSWNSMKYYK